MSIWTGLLEYFTSLDYPHRIVYAVSGLAVVVISGVAIRKFVRSNYFAYFTQYLRSADYPRDTVILHGYGRGPHAPSLSPFILKLETYLRITNIPYKIVRTLRSSSKGKWSWIQYNGEVVADSEFCIRYLNSKFNVDLNKHLNVYDKGVAESLKVMSDEHLVWCYSMFRYAYDPNMTVMRRMFNLGPILGWYMRRYALKFFYYQGTGRHDKEEVLCLLSRDLTAIQSILGQKKFLMGDRVCEADCALFAHLAQIYWHFVDSEMETYLKDTFPSLASYCERMKTSFWPDWDDCTTRGFTAEAKK